VKKLLIGVLAWLAMAATGLGQATARFPASVATSTDLLCARNNAQTALAAPLATTDTALSVYDGSVFCPDQPFNVAVGTQGLVEVIKICSVVGNSLNVCVGGRQQERTSLISSPKDTLVRATMTETYHNQAAAEIAALEAALGVNFSNLSNLVVPPTGQWAWTLLDSSSLAAETISDIVSNRLGRSVTVQEVWCETDVAGSTITLQLQRGGAALLSTALVCNNPGVSTTSFMSGQSTFSNGDALTYVATAPSGTAPKRISVAVRYQ
jgi:hypothetical protein